MEQDTPQKDLKEIRSLMERSVIYNSLSGLSGIAAGLIGILIYFITYWFIEPLLERNPDISNTPEGQLYLTKMYFTASIICTAMAFIAIFYFNSRKAKREKLPFLDLPMQKMFINLFIPLISGGIYCLALVHEQEYLLVAPNMLVFYGLAMIMASKHTIIEIRYLGFAELCLGLIALFIKSYSLWFWLLGFGVLNIIYGAYIFYRYERNRKENV